MSDIVPTPTERSSFIDGLEPSRAGNFRLLGGPDGSLPSPRLAPPLVWPECECPDDCRMDHEND
jgi:hypothetical protein